MPVSQRHRCLRFGCNFIPALSVLVAGNRGRWTRRDESQQGSGDGLRGPGCLVGPGNRALQGSSAWTNEQVLPDVTARRLVGPILEAYLWQLGTVRWHASFRAAPARAMPPLRCLINTALPLVRSAGCATRHGMAILSATTAVGSQELGSPSFLEDGDLVGGERALTNCWVCRCLSLRRYYGPVSLTSVPGQHAGGTAACPMSRSRAHVMISHRGPRRYHRAFGAALRAPGSWRPVTIG